MIYVIVKRVAHSLRGVPWPLARTRILKHRRPCSLLGKGGSECQLYFMKDISALKLFRHKSLLIVDTQPAGVREGGMG